MILQESLGWPNPLQHNSRSHHLSVISCSGHWCLSDREWLRTQATSSEEWKLSTCRWSVPTELCERGVRFVGLCPIRLALKCTDWKYWTIRPSNRILFLQDSSRNTSRIQGFGSSRPRKKTSLLLPLLKVVGRKRYPIFIDIPHIGGCVSVNFVWMISTMKSFTKASADKQVQTDDNPRASRTVLLSIYMVCGRAMSFHVVSWKNARPNHVGWSNAKTPLLEASIISLASSIRRPRAHLSQGTETPHDKHHSLTMVQIWKHSDESRTYWSV